MSSFIVEPGYSSKVPTAIAKYWKECSHIERAQTLMVLGVLALVIFNPGTTFILLVSLVIAGPGLATIAGFCCFVALIMFAPIWIPLLMFAQMVHNTHKDKQAKIAAVQLTSFKVLMLQIAEEKRTITIPAL